jgi:hypothetical protein
MKNEKWVNYFFKNLIPLTTQNLSVVQFSNRHRIVSYTNGKK